MQTYFPLDISEEALKARVAQEFFSDFAYEPFGKSTAKQPNNLSKGQQCMM